MMHNAALRRATAVALCLAAAGCGGSPSHPRPATARGAIIDRCAATASGEPGAMGLCLARHGIAAPSGGRLVDCAEAANTRAQVTACLAKAVR